ncbi:DUF2264 domain-containing protein [Agromyces cerinus]|nr:DUF2264 domain-containing protein [Agromyces cerinus]
MQQPTPRGRWMPPLELERSPITGYGRAHWITAADRILGAARRRSSEHGASVDFAPDGAAPAGDIDRLEGFARTFLLAAMRIAGDPGGSEELIERYRSALSHAVAARLWPRLADHSQPTVEAAAIAIGLHLAQAELWDRLDRTTQERLCAWFDQARGTWCADNNHVLLGATLAAFTTSVGAGDARPVVANALDRMDDWYVGDGWYTDGDGRRFDHYNAYAFHWYPFFIARMLGAELDERRQLYRERLASFLDGYQHLFGADGAPVLIGRSLIYRWAVTAPFWMARLEQVDAISAGRTRRLASGALRYFVDGGTLDDGMLSLGWQAAPTPGIVQSYSGPGSPYWASKGFLGLLLPEDDAVWQQTESPLEIERRDVRKVIAGPGWLIDARTDDGIARLHNFGSDGHPLRDDGLYRRLAFSSATAPALGGTGRDADLTVEGAAHRPVLRATVGANGGAATRTLDAAGRQVQTEIAMRLHHGTAVFVARVTGAVALRLVVSANAVSTSNADLESSVDDAARRASTTTTRLTSTIHWLGAWRCGDVANGAPVDLAPEAGVEVVPAGTALGVEAAYPLLRTRPLPDDAVVIAWRTSLSAIPRITESPVAATASISSDRVALTIGDGTLWFRWSQAPAGVQDGAGQRVFRP